ncbi:hypothetical protein [Kitasatospora sp. NPDC085879]|uniref:hypothetical protein n=1 Tax=Kitasatospora sp. NPDC085879 TaxID=3154769 RepID=UPI0034468B3A
MRNDAQARGPLPDPWHTGRTLAPAPTAAHAFDQLPAVIYEVLSHLGHPGFPAAFALGLRPAPDPATTG